ncbi:ANTAR domain-containing response regulator [Pedomonas mirosovicensis]|uniref:ANTAR domain-containing response regulator n=1 Tax=Pedomonas mirosovicensis TaxID=2908641 RepID=UPI002168088B|nr:ANTAR domain-containing protein [Pedomonas mirosovicensis]MCH8686638.1 ANTAR domain-containing protein [Pedomonas mirosovicensis]
MRIAVIDDNPVRGAVLEAGLREAGLEDIHILSGRARLLARLVALEPDVVLIDIENPSRDVLDEMFQVSRAVARPIAMFVDQSDASMIEAAIDAGVSAYVVDGLRKERVKPILDLAISRFNFHARLAAELEAAKTALAERKLLDRAKGILMRQRGIDEPAAYALLRSSAMKQGRKIAEIAQAVITADELLTGGEGA